MIALGQHVPAVNSFVAPFGQPLANNPRINELWLHIDAGQHSLWDYCKQAAASTPTSRTQLGKRCPPAAVAILLCHSGLPLFASGLLSGLPSGLPSGLFRL